MIYENIHSPNVHVSESTVLDEDLAYWTKKKIAELDLINSVHYALKRNEKIHPDQITLIKAFTNEATANKIKA